MDHLGIDKFMVLGFCIGGPFIWNLIKRAPDRVVAAVLAQPSGSRPEMRDLFYDNNMKGWGPELIKRRPDITMETVDKFLTRMYRTNPDFVFTVTRDFVRNCQTPVLILPDDVPAHPYAVAMEAAMLAPKAEVSMFPWKEPKERIPLAVRQIRSFLRAHRPAVGLGAATALALLRPLQRDVVERVRLVGEPHEFPAARDGEFHDRAVHPIGAEIRVGVGEIVEHQIAARLHLRRRHARIAARAVIRVVAVDVDPVEMIVGKLRQHLVRQALMDRHAAVRGDRRIEQRHIDIDQMQFGRIAGVEDVAREAARDRSRLRRRVPGAEDASQDRCAKRRTGNPPIAPAECAGMAGRSP